MDTIELLQQRAQKLRVLLEQYAKIDDDVALVLGFMVPFLDEIKAGEVIPPQRDRYRWYFFSTDSPLFSKYEDLSQAEAEYAETLEGWDFPYP